MRQAVKGIFDLYTFPGIINVDLANVRSIKKNGGPALVGVGRASGEKRIEKALDLALHSPLLDDTVFKKGKVRDVYDLCDQLLMVASDRISAFDFGLPTLIPDQWAVVK